MLSRKKLRIAQQCFSLSFVIYLSAVVYLLFFSRMDTPISLWNIVGRLDPDSIPGMNLVPFGTISCYLSCLIPGNAYAQVSLCNLLGNFLIFLPMGFYLPLLSGSCRSTGNFALRMFLVTFSVEFIQLLTGLGTFDVDDMILNMAGALVGYSLCADAAAAFQNLFAPGLAS
jgi:glycopeptide antibiotics resistance protein